ncbi:MAG: hypothetical protein LBU12_09460, partial [Deltaproteobacteria bacterium]|nr:hypothetical protein [Deltaproteobacteria bacterium]
MPPKQAAPARPGRPAAPAGPARPGRPAAPAELDFPGPAAGRPTAPAKTRRPTSLFRLLALAAFLVLLARLAISGFYLA